METGQSQWLRLAFAADAITDAGTHLPRFCRWQKPSGGFAEVCVIPINSPGGATALDASAKVPSIEYRAQQRARAKSVALGNTIPMPR